jgi:hypothetical protein
MRACTFLLFSLRFNSKDKAALKGITATLFKKKKKGREKAMSSTAGVKAD